mmetsp:Transcript_9904/g.16994  ORF Transcript_9904/g.16994 Transcript_9904/m.16994 type:complete len:682 (-) Transcript_9904:262-2307(-)
MTKSAEKQSRNASAPRGKLKKDKDKGKGKGKDKDKDKHTNPRSQKAENSNKSIIPQPQDSDTYSDIGIGTGTDTDTDNPSTMNNSSNNNNGTTASDINKPRKHSKQKLHSHSSQQHGPIPLQLQIESQDTEQAVLTAFSTFRRLVKWLEHKVFPRGVTGWLTWIIITLVIFYAVDLYSMSDEGIPQHVHLSTGIPASDALHSSSLQHQEQQQQHWNTQGNPSIFLPVSQQQQTIQNQQSHSDSSHALPISQNAQAQSQQRMDVPSIGVAIGGTSTTSSSSSSAAGDEYMHPMDRNLERLMVPSSNQQLTQEQTKGFIRKLVLAYLYPFKQGITRNAFFQILNRKSYGVTPDGANKGTQSILFQIKDKRVYMLDPYEVPRNSKDFYRARINEMIWILSAMAAAGRIHDTEFLVSIHDCVQTVSKRHNYRAAKYVESNPVFTIVACNFSDNIPFPMWEGDILRGGGYQKWDSRMVQFATDYVPWKDKEPKAVFRGGYRPSAYFNNKNDADDHCEDMGRSRLFHLGQLRSELFDVSIGGRCGAHAYNLRRLTPEEHHRYKYVVYTEGNCFWADRMNRQLFGPSAIIKQETPCGQFYEPLMKPFVHYIPTDFFMADTVDRIQWARENDELVRGIVQNANQFAKTFLSLEGIQLYIEILLYEYTSLLVSRNIAIEPGAIDVTGKRV